MEACADCSKWLSGTEHYFINVLLSDFSEQLWIPQKFHRHFQDKVGKTFLLTGLSGGTCSVQLTKINAILCFKDGWRAFAEENLLSEGELLLFRYDGELSFKVEVFDRTACQREDASLFEDLRKAEVKGGATPIITTNEKVTTVVGSSESTEDSQSEMPERETKSKKPKSAAPKHKYAKCFVSSRRPVTHEEQNNAFRAAASMKLDFPSFMVTMKPTCVLNGFYVNIPVGFLRKQHLLDKAGLVKLVVKGREWPVRLVRRANRGGLDAGWSDFVYDNILEEADVCVFELITKEPLTMNVSIFRVVEETTPLKVKKIGRG